MIRTIPFILAVALFLGGCASHRGPGSIAGGECKIFEAPKYAVQGKTQYDQDWVDSTIEGGVGGCHWKRPAQRPAELERPGVQVKAAPKPAAKRHSWFTRVKTKVVSTFHRKPSEAPSSAPAFPDTQVAPIVQVPAPEIKEQAPQQPTVAPAPRSRIDQLLHPEHF